MEIDNSIESGHCGSERITKDEDIVSTSFLPNVYYDNVSLNAATTNQLRKEFLVTEASLYKAISSNFLQSSITLRLKEKGY